MMTSAWSRSSVFGRSFLVLAALAIVAFIVAALTNSVAIIVSGFVFGFAALAAYGLDLHADGRSPREVVDHVQERHGARPGARSDDVPYDQETAL